MTSEDARWENASRQERRDVNRALRRGVTLSSDREATLAVQRAVLWGDELRLQRKTMSVVLVVAVIVCVVALILSGVVFLVLAAVNLVIVMSGFFVVRTLEHRAERGEEAHRAELSARKA